MYTYQEHAEHLGKAEISQLFSRMRIVYIASLFHNQLVTCNRICMSSLLRIGRPSKVDQNFVKDPNINVSQRPDDHEDRDRDDAHLQYFCLAIDCKSISGNVVA